MARPAVSQDKLSYEGGVIKYRLKSPWSDGRTELTFQPMAFLSRMAAIMPPPRKHFSRHSGIFAPAHRLRKLIIRSPDKKKVFQPGGPKTEPRLVKNTLWSKLLSRIFEIDVGRCPRCAGEMKVVSFLFDGFEIARYLRHQARKFIGPPLPPDQPDTSHTIVLD